jgi:cobalamin biosynthesis Mg chelatase CobN
MSRTSPHARSSVLRRALPLAVLAVLAFACSPALAHAEEATGPQYEPDIPTVPQEQSPGGGGHTGSSGGGNAGVSNSPGGTEAGGGNGQGTGGGSHTGQTNQASDANNGKPKVGAGDAEGEVGQGKALVKAGEPTASTSGDESSSPLVPILIAIVVLAAISIGAFYYRQRRQGAGSSVSPKAS